MTFDPTKNKNTFYRVCLISGAIAMDEYSGLYSTHEDALIASRKILEERREKLRNELDAIDAALSAS